MSDAIYLAKLQLTGLKAEDRTIEFGPYSIISGQNGAGKSAVLAALHLLVHGKAPGVAATSDGILRLARDGKSIAVKGWWSDGTWVSREWKTTKKAGKEEVKESVRSNLPGADGLNASALKGLVTATFGGLSESWNPGELLDLSAAKLRDRLMRLRTGAEWTLDAIVPAECPKWCAPEVLGVEDPEAWIERAIAMVSDRVRDEQSDARKAKAAIEEYGDAWSGEAETSPIEAELKTLRTKLLSVRERELLLGRIATAEKDLEARRARLGGAPDATASRACAEQLEPLEAEATRLAAVRAKSRAEYEASLKEHIRLKGRARAEHVCPQCGYDLSEGLEAELAAVESRTKALDARLAKDAAALAKAEKARDALGLEARHAATRVNDYASERRRIADLEVDLEVMMAERDELPPVTDTADVLEAQIKAAQQRLTEVGASNERAAALTRAKADVASTDRRIAELKEVAAAFERIQTDMLRRSKAWLETKLGAAYGGAVSVELAPKHCRLMVDEVDVSALSGGERLRFIAALVRTIGSASGARYRPLIIDGLEAVSIDNRATFLDAVHQAVIDGDVSQAILAGCADSIPPFGSAAVTFIELGSLEERVPTGRVTFVGEPGIVRIDGDQSPGEIRAAAKGLTAHLLGVQEKHHGFQEPDNFGDEP